MDVTAKSEADRGAVRFAMNLSMVVGVHMFVMKTSAYSEEAVIELSANQSLE